jgi:hypothetical protein
MRPPEATMAATVTLRDSLPSWQRRSSAKIFPSQILVLQFLSRTTTTLSV